MTLADQLDPAALAALERIRVLAQKKRREYAVAKKQARQNREADAAVTAPEPVVQDDIANYQSPHND